MNIYYIWGMKRLPFKDEFVNYWFAKFKYGYIEATVSSVVFKRHIKAPFLKGLINTGILPTRFRLNLEDALLTQEIVKS